MDLGGELMRKIKFIKKGEERGTGSWCYQAILQTRQKREGGKENRIFNIELFYYNNKAGGRIFTHEIQVT